MFMGAFSFQTFAEEPEWDTYSDTWVAVDDLGREVFSSDTKDVSADPDDGVNPIVGMFYYLWQGHEASPGAKIKDNTEILKENPDDPQFGNEYEYHWWGRPLLDYYFAGDPFVVAKHMQMLCDAGVDFYFFDTTNALIYADRVRLVMAEIDRRQALGLKTPKLCFCIHSSPAATATNIYNEFYADSKYDKYWFEWGDKPLLLGPPSEVQSGASADVYNRFRFRNCWAWMGGRNANEWPWLENYPQQAGWTLNTDGTHKVEQLSVSTAQHPVSKIGKSYHNGSEPSFTKYGVCLGKNTSKGFYYEEQWKRAHEVRAPVLMITQFNEWIAMRFIIKSAGEYGNVRPGATAKIGESYFVDAYTAEFNRDIEPSTHPLIRDNYLMQTYSHMRRYKGVRDIPVPESTKTITLDGDMAQWADVTPEFRDDKGDILHRNYPNANQIATLTDETGRNDIIISKVTKDYNNMYFYAQTSNKLSSLTLLKNRHMWMTLLINIDTDYTNGWAGYDYMAYYNDDTRAYTLAKFTGVGFEHEDLMPVTVYKTDNEMYFALPRDLLGVKGVDCDIDFKWADNMNDVEPDVLDFYVYGDCAPNGRFNYRYKGSKVTAGIDNVFSGSPLAVIRNGANAVDVNLYLQSAGEVVIDCYNMQGSLVLSKRFNAQPGDFRATLELPGRGYIIKAIADNTVKTAKVL